MVDTGADELGFLYIASVSVIPELLAESRSGTQALKEVSVMRGRPFLLMSVRCDGVWGVLHGCDCLERVE